MLDMMVGAAQRRCSLKKEEQQNAHNCPLGKMPANGSLYLRGSGGHFAKRTDVNVPVCSRAISGAYF